MVMSLPGYARWRMAAISIGYNVGVGLAVAVGVAVGEGVGVAVELGRGVNEAVRLAGLTCASGVGWTVAVEQAAAHSSRIAAGNSRSSRLWRTSRRSGSCRMR